MKATILLFAFIFIFLADFVYAQDKTIFGPHITYQDSDSPTSGDLGVGGRVVIPVKTVWIQPYGNYYFMSTPEGFTYDWDLWDVGVDVLYPFRKTGGVVPYAGAGVNVATFSADRKDRDEDPLTDSFKSRSAVLSIVGGIQFRSNNSSPIPAIEIRYIFNTKFDEIPIDRLLLSASLLY